MSGSRTSGFHQVDLVNVECLARAEEGDDDGEADGGLGCGYDHHEEDEDLALDLVPQMGEGDEGQVDGVEHQLDRHEDGDDVALDEERCDADGEEDGGEDQVVSDGYHRASGSSSF